MTRRECSKISIVNVCSGNECGNIYPLCMLESVFAKNTHLLHLCIDRVYPNWNMTSMQRHMR